MSAMNTVALTPWTSRHVKNGLCGGSKMSTVDTFNTPDEHTLAILRLKKALRYKEALKPTKVNVKMS